MDIDFHFVDRMKQQVSEAESRVLKAERQLYELEELLKLEMERRRIAEDMARTARGQLEAARYAIRILFEEHGRSRLS